MRSVLCCGATWPLLLAMALVATGACREAPGVMAPEGAAQPALPVASNLRVPVGFVAETLATGLRAPAGIAVGPDGRVYVAEAASGRLLALPYPGPGAPQVVAEGFTQPLGMAFRGSELYVSHRGAISQLRDADGDGRYEVEREIVTGLPTGHHQNEQPVFGPDGRLYFALGSTCNACVEGSPLSATILRLDVDSGALEVFANGLRNTYDIAFHPEDGSLWGADNGRDDLGDHVPEELNLVQEGRHYGWPDCWGARGQAPAADCSGTARPVLELEPRASADGILFYTGSQFPVEYRNNIFLAMYGSHAGYAGRKVVRVVLERDPKAPWGWRAMASDFLIGAERPLDLALAPDGALLVADIAAGVLYRVRWVGPSR